MNLSSGQRSPGAKLFFAILIGILLAIPLFATWFIIYDRESQSETATTSITQGWGGPQRIAGPKLIIPYTAEVEQTFTEGNKEVVRKVKEEREFTVKAAALNMSTDVKPERRSKSIYEAIIYEATTSGQARFAIPADLKEQGVDPATLLLGRAELRFEVSDPNGLVGAPPSVKVAGQQLKLAPIESGFSAKLDASAIQGKPIVAEFAFS